MLGLDHCGSWVSLYSWCRKARVHWPHESIMPSSYCYNETSTLWAFLLSRSGWEENKLFECFHDFMEWSEKTLFTQRNPIPENVLSLRKFSIDSSAFRRPYFSLRFDEFLIYRCAKLRSSDRLGIQLCSTCHHVQGEFDHYSYIRWHARSWRIPAYAFLNVISDCS